VTVSSTEATLPVKLYMGDGNDTVTLDGGGPSPLAGPVTLYMGYGNDTVTLGGGPDRLAGFASPVTVYGQEGLDDIVVNNAADPGPAPFFGSMYWITSTDVELNERLLLTYDTAESLAINAGSGNDGIWVTSTRAETPVVFRAGAGSDTFLVGWTNPAQVAGAVTLDGQGGTDLLDYWWYFEDVRVNLALGTATRVAGGISNIEKVHGGWGNDIIVGNDMANTLYGGPGRDILIGRGGADVVAGQSSDDILIGGSTVHDLIPARLEDLMREWSRTDLEGGAPSQYQARVYHLQGVSGGLNGTTILDLSTVIDDGAADSLHGEADLDWFFQFGADVIASLDNWEHVN
jgi:Ca2+-binding RTX toxin-like protein